MRTAILACCVVLVLPLSTHADDAETAHKTLEPKTEMHWRLFADSGRTWEYSTTYHGDKTAFGSTYEVTESTDTLAKVSIVDEGGEVGDDGKRSKTEKVIDIEFTAETRLKSELAPGNGWDIEKEEEIKVKAGKFWCERQAKTDEKGIKHRRWISAHFHALLVKHDYPNISKGELQSISKVKGDPKWNTQPDLEEMGDDDQWKLFRKVGRKWLWKTTYEANGKVQTEHFALVEVTEAGVRYCDVVKTIVTEDCKPVAGYDEQKFHGEYHKPKEQPRWLRDRWVKDDEPATVEAAGKKWECNVYRQQLGRDNEEIIWASKEYPTLQVQARSGTTTDFETTILVKFWK